METVTRSGKMTSEFWLVLVFIGVVVLNGTPYVDIDGENIALLATLAFGYGGGRTLIKNTLAKNGATS